MVKWKKKLVQQFLPAWAKVELLAENERLKRENVALQHKLELQKEYINGLERGIRSQHRIAIYAGEVTPK